MKDRIGVAPAGGANLSTMTADLLARARAGDDDAFASLVALHRRELHVHCYRMLGSTQDAEDVLQETLLSAWRGLAAFEERASLRTWLYRIATSRCLNARRARSRRPPSDPGRPPGDPPPPNRPGEVLWLQPYPDVLLDELGDHSLDPAARLETRESISLSFVVALQLLPPRQRAVLVLRDVLAFRAAEVATMLDTTEDSVTSALKRARATIRRRGASAAAPLPGSPTEQRLVEELTRAYDAGDVDAVVAMLTDDTWLTMPPMPFAYEGRALVSRFVEAVIFRDDVTYELIPTRSNGQPAFGAYTTDPRTGERHATGLMVVTLAGDRVAGLSRFGAGVLEDFGLPRCLPAC